MAADNKGFDLSGLVGDSSNESTFTSPGTALPEQPSLVAPVFDLSGMEGPSGLKPTKVPEISALPSRPSPNLVLQAVAGRDPQKSSNINKFAREFSLPHTQIEADYDTFKIRSYLNGLNTEEIKTKAPTVAEYLSTPNMASMVHDDVPRLVEAENSINTAKSVMSDYFDDISKAWDEGEKQVQLSDSGINWALTQITGDEFSGDIQADFNALNAMSNPSEDYGWLAGAPVTFAQTLPALMDIIGSGVQTGAEGALYGSAAGATIGSLFPVVGTAGGAVTGFTLGGGYAYRFGASQAAFNLEGGLAAIEYSGIKDEAGNTLDPKIASYAAVSVGAVNAGLEYLSLAIVGTAVNQTVKSAIRYNVRKALQTESGRQAVTRIASAYLKMVGKEGGIEGLQEFVNVAGGEFAKFVDPDSFKGTELGDAVDQIFSVDTAERVGSGVYAGTQAGLIFGAPTTFVNAASYVASNKSSTYEKEQGQIDKIADALALPKLREMEPEQFRQFIEQVDGEDGTQIFLDGPQTSLYLKQFTQDQIDNDPTLLMLQEQNAEAQALGTPMSISLADFGTSIVGSKHYQSLRDGMTMAADSYSPATIKLAQQSEQNFVEKLKAEADRRAVIVEESNAISQTVVQQLVDTGRHNPEEAKALVQPFMAYVSIVADREGKTVQEVYDGFGLTIEGPMTGEMSRLKGELGAFFDQPPAYKDASYIYDSVRNSYLDVFPEDAMFDEVMEDIGSASPAMRPLLNALNDADWLGFDYPSQALDSIMSEDQGNYELPQNVKSALGRLVNNEASLMQSANQRGEQDAVFDPLSKEGAVFNQSSVDRGPRGDGGISTRLPTAKKPLEDALIEPLVVGLESSKADRRSFEKNVEVIEEYDNYRPTKSADTPDKKAERFINHIKENLLWLHDQVDEDTRNRSRMWYDGARNITDRWVERFGVPDTAVAGVLAALSPQKDWFMNVSLAERVLDTYMNKADEPWSKKMTTTAKRIFNKPQYAMMMGNIKGKKLSELSQPVEIAAWIRIYDEAHNNRGHRIVSPEGNFQDFAEKGKGGEKKTGWGSLVEIAKAVSVIQDPSIRNINTRMGNKHKVRNFYNNIIAPNSDMGDVTIDTHAVAAGLLKPLAGASLEVTHNFGSGGVASSNATGSSGTYGLYAEAYRRAATERGILPRQMQSITWEATRGLFSPTYKANDNNVQSVADLWKQHKSGKLSLDKVRVQINEHAKGITDPSWVGHPSGLPGGAVDSSYLADVSELRVSRPRQPDTGRPVSGRDSGDTGLLNQGEGTTRGYYDPNNTLIRLTDSSDLSTFLHEFAHFMLEMERTGQSPEIFSINNWFKRNAEEVAAEAGSDSTAADVVAFIDNGTSGDQAKDQAINRSMHEQFARGFEGYLMEGKAPSVELRNAFRKFAAWMAQIYKSIKGSLKVNLDEDIRGVFNRLLATEEQIEMAKAREQLEPMFTDQALSGMTDAEWESYQKRINRVSDKAKETLRDKLIKEVTRQTKDWWKSETQTIYETEIARVQNEEPYRAMEDIRESEVKLDRAAVKELVGVTKTDKLGRTSTRAPALFNGLTQDGGVDPSLHAEMLGYESGEAMLNTWMKQPTKEQVARERADAQMIEKYGDIMTDGTIEKEAEAALMNEERGKLILQEFKALNKKAGKPNVERQAIKDLAQQKIDAQTVKSINPKKYRAGELQAARDSGAALTKGDIEAAAAAKMRQAVNYEMWMAATEAKANTDKMLTKVARYRKKSVIAEIMKGGEDYWGQMAKILDRFELKKSATLKEVEALNTWLKHKIEVMGEGLILDPTVLNEDYRKHWKEISYKELKGVYDSLRNIEHVARYTNKIDVLGKKVDYEETVRDLVEHITSNTTKPFPAAQMITVDERKSDSGWKASLASMTKIPFLVSWLDDGERAGKAHAIINQPFNEAQAHEFRLWRDVGKVVLDLIAARSKEDKKRHMKRVLIPEIRNDAANESGYLMGSQILAVALNTGNQGNLEKMLKGEGWVKEGEQITTDNPQLQAILKHMTESDWVLVQAIWDQMDLLYPALADVHRKTTGIVPPKIAATPVNTKFGTFKGGYYPMVYDRYRSTKADENQTKSEESVDTLFNPMGMGIQSSVTAGATNERTKFFDKVRFSLDVVPNHFQETIHYIAFHDAVRQTNKLLRDSRLKEAIVGSVGLEEYNLFKPWLNDIAKEGRESRTKQFGERFMQKLRLGSTIAMMGFKASTLIMQTLGVSNIVAETGMKNTLLAFRTILMSEQSMAQAWEYARESSNVLEFRVKTFDREVNNAFRSLEGRNTWFSNLQQASMAPIAYVQLYMVDLPTWYAAYHKEMGSSADEAKAIRYADWAVENIQGSGLTKDLSAIMREKNELYKAVTMFMTYFSALFNSLRDIKEGTGRGEYNTADVAARLTFFIIMPVILEMMMKDEIDTEDEDAIQKILTRIVLLPAATVPVFRDIASGVLSEYPYNPSPLYQTIEGAAKGVKGLAEDITEGEMPSQTTVKQLSRAVGSYVGVPATYQTWNTFSHLSKVAEEGEDLTIRELLFGQKRD